MIDSSDENIKKLFSDVFRWELVLRFNRINSTDLRLCLMTIFTIALSLINHNHYVYASVIHRS